METVVRKLDLKNISSAPDANYSVNSFVSPRTGDCDYIFERKNRVHETIGVSKLYQCGSFLKTRDTVLVELFSHIIEEPCYEVLRTQEQLGYILETSVRKFNNKLGK